MLSDQVMEQQLKVTEEELKTLQSIREANDTAVIELGRIYYQKTILESQEKVVKEDVILLQKKEEQFSNELVSKYGDIKVDLETGTIS
jgi:hypothetical protein